MQTADIEVNAESREGHWEHFEYVADTGVRGYGPPKEAAFEQAALALTSVITYPGAVQPNEAITIDCKAPGEEILLFEWLNATFYQMACHKMLFSRFDSNRGV